MAGAILPLLLFFAANAEAPFSGNVVHLDGLPPNDGTGYFVLFHKDGCIHCDELEPSFNSAAELGEGLTVWAELNCTQNSIACEEVHIDALPQLFYFRDGTIYPYLGLRIARLLVTWVSGFVLNTAAVVDAANYSVSADEKVALLLTEKAALPKVWAAIERALNRSDIRFFASRDRNLQTRLGLPTFPAVYALRGSDSWRFDGRLSVRDAVKFYRSTFPDDQAEL
jgi:hypothetical protein